MLKSKDVCLQGCGRCCGIVPANAIQYRQIIAYAEEKGILPVRQGARCPWFQNGMCAVYLVRPAICRLFGKVADPLMICRHGGKFSMLPPGKVERIMANERKAAGDQGTMFLHQACCSIEEIKCIIDAETAPELH